MLNQTYDGYIPSPDPTTAVTSGNQATSEPISVLKEAESVINGPRRQEYGACSTSFDDISKMWSVVIGAPVTAQQVAQCMVCLKLVRLKQSPDHRGSQVDIAGYAGCMEKITRGE